MISLFRFSSICLRTRQKRFGPDALEGEIVLSTAFRTGMRLQAPGSSERVSLPIEIAVRDNGPGIPEGGGGGGGEFISEMFDPFVTTEGERKWPWSCFGSQDHRRPRRNCRMRSRRHAAPRFASCCPCSVKRPRAVPQPAVTNRTIPNNRTGTVHAQPETFSSPMTNAAIRTRAESGPVPGRVRSALDRKRLHAVALGIPGGMAISLSRMW